MGQKTRKKIDTQSVISLGVVKELRGFGELLVAQQTLVQANLDLQKKVSEIEVVNAFLIRQNGELTRRAEMAEAALEDERARKEVKSKKSKKAA